MSGHEFCDSTTKVHDQDEEQKYRHHQSTSMITSPLSKFWVCCLQILGLKNGKSRYDDDEKECKNTWFRDSEDLISTAGDHHIRLRESFLEHIEGREEDDEETNPLDRWIAIEKFCYITRCYHHQDDWDDESDNEIGNVSMTRTGDSEDIIETHGYICENNRLDGSPEILCPRGSLFMMFTCSYLTVEFPYDIEEEECTEEFEAWNLEEVYDSQGEYNTEYRCSCDSPEDGFFSEFRCELLCCHPDKDRIVPTHDEIDEDDVQESKSTCRGEEMSKITLKWSNEFEHRSDNK